MTRTCERTARGIALIKPLLLTRLKSSHGRRNARPAALRLRTCSLSIMAVLPHFFITKVGRFLYSYQRKGGGEEGFNRIFSRFQKDFQGLLESALDV